MNILLLQNGKQYSIRSCSMGFQTFCFISLVLFAHKVPLCIYFLCISPGLLDVRVLIGRHQWKAAKAESLEHSLPLCSCCHGTSSCLFINSSTLLSDLKIKVEWAISNWKRAPPLCSVVTCALRNTPKNEQSSLHSQIVYVLFWQE